MTAPVEAPPRCAREGCGAPESSHEDLGDETAGMCLEKGCSCLNYLPAAAPVPGEEAPRGVTFEDFSGRPVAEEYAGLRDAILHGGVWAAPAPAPREEAPRTEPWYARDSPYAAMPPAPPEAQTAPRDERTSETLKDLRLRRYDRVSTGDIEALEARLAAAEERAAKAERERDAARKTREENVDNERDEYADLLAETRRFLADALRERDEAFSLAYVGEHRFPDLTWKARCAEAQARVRALEEALRNLLEKGWSEHHVAARAALAAPPSAPGVSSITSEWLTQTVREQAQHEEAEGEAGPAAKEAEERAAIVRWLREQGRAALGLGCFDVGDARMADADAIERGEHHTKGGGR